MKTCSKCKIEKSLTDFYKNKAAKDNLSWYCKPCTKIEASKRWVKYKAKYSENNLNWLRTNKEKRSKYNRKQNLKRKYNIDQNVYLNMYSIQNGQCAICKIFFAKLVIDHCHNSNKIRGLLCNQCNLGIGYFKDSKMNLDNAIKYLQIGITND